MEIALLSCLLSPRFTTTAAHVLAGCRVTFQFTIHEGRRLRLTQAVPTCPAPFRTYRVASPTHSRTSASSHSTTMGILNAIVKNIAPILFVTPPTYHPPPTNKSPQHSNLPHNQLWRPDLLDAPHPLLRRLLSRHSPNNAPRLHPKSLLLVRRALQHLAARASPAHDRRAFTMPTRRINESTRTKYNAFPDGCRQVEAPVRLLAMAHHTPVLELLDILLPRPAVPAPPHFPNALIHPICRSPGLHCTLHRSHAAPPTTLRQLLAPRLRWFPAERHRQLGHWRHLQDVVLLCE